MTSGLVEKPMALAGSTAARLPLSPVAAAQISLGCQWAKVVPDGYVEPMWNK
jgi:hypothetical protein